MDVYFGNPLDGRRIPIVYADMVDLALSKGEEYWNSPVNNSQATLEIYRNEKNAELSKCLVFSMKDNLGFHINYQNWDKGRLVESWYPVSNTDFSETIWLNSAGEQIQLAKALFITIEDALKVFETFFNSGGRSPDVRWLTSNDIPWDTFEDYRSS